MPVTRYILSFFILFSYLPAYAENTPQGFGAGTIGGAGGAVVRVHNRNELQHALCQTYGPGGFCSDATPRIVEVDGTFDYTGTEGRDAKPGCLYGDACPASSPYKSEMLALLNSDDKHCDGKPIIQVAFDNAPNNPLKVGSNKTVIGIGASATLKGKGLALKGVRNVIIRNLTFSDINQGVIFAGDALTLDDVDHVWIDHNHFKNIGRQMIVGGFKPTLHVSISWNDFDGENLYSHNCSGKHYWNLLMAAKAQSITMSYNWFHHFSGRAPKIGGDDVVVHMVNNYFEDGSWHALDAVDPARVLVEGNDFENVVLPITRTDHPGHIFGMQGDLDVSSQAKCHAVLGRSCLGNIANPPPKVNGFNTDSSVLDAFAKIPGPQIESPIPAQDVPAMVKAGAGTGHI
ncbi:pectate lyase [Pseudomonas sp. MWU13-2105]|uniref:pectate lyase family protein n=1 Tax=Pseudomonas sp. MWU13-2105 TaxID=2935074 RepID=UPI00200E6BFE|nr:pectate lyase [Pseudomonas sp. MWU13-2105]